MTVLVHIVKKALLFWPQEARMLKEVLPIACQTVAYLPGFSLISGTGIFYTLWKYKEYFFSDAFHSAHLELDNYSCCSFQSVPPHCQLLSWRKTTQLSSCDVKCNWEPSLDWCIFSFGAPLIGAGLRTSVSVNIVPISFWLSEWLAFLRNKKETWYSRGYLQADKIKSWNSFPSFGKCLWYMLRGKGVVGPVLWSNSLRWSFLLWNQFLALLTTLLLLGQGKQLKLLL